VLDETKKTVGDKMNALMWIGIVIVGVAVTLFSGINGISADAGFAGVSPRFYPTVVGSMLSVLGLLLVWQGWREKRAPQNFVTEPAQAPAAPDFSLGVWVVGALLASAFLIEKIGFVLSATLLFVLAARGFGSRTYGRNILIGLVICFPVFWMFTKGLNVSLPKLINTWI
jgi:putative tricarboxylic transport membrane protein